MKKLLHLYFYRFLCPTMIRALFLIFILILSCGSFIACSESTDEDDAHLAGGGPVVRLVDHGIESGRKEEVVFSVSYSLEIDEPLDHRLLLLVNINIELYTENHEENEIYEDSWMAMYIIEKGHTNSGKYVERFIVDDITRVLIQLLPAKDRSDPDNLDKLIGATFPAKDDQIFGRLVRIPHDYKFNPYQLGSPNELVFNVAEALAEPTEDE